MIPKSGYRFSEKIMLQQKATRKLDAWKVQSGKARTAHFE